MGASRKRRNRKIRRRTKMGIKSGHRLVAGRTGRVHFKRRHGALVEVKRRKES